MELTAEADGLESAFVRVISSQGDTKPNFIPSVNERYIMKWRQAVELFSERPDPSVKIEDHDMNTWAVITAGGDYEDRYKGAEGYGLYKTTANIYDTDKYIVFREIMGNEVEVFVNGEQKFAGDCQWGRKIDVDVSDISGEADIAVIIHSSEKKSNGGILRTVVITD